MKESSTIGVNLDIDLKLHKAIKSSTKEQGMHLGKAYTEIIAIGWAQVKKFGGLYECKAAMKSGSGK